MLELVYITNKDRKEAKKIALHLLKKRLIACANIFPVDSFYWWQGKVVDDKEFVLLVKTKKGSFAKIKKEVEKIHSYKIPCIIRLSGQANKKYLNWLKKETNI